MKIDISDHSDLAVGFKSHNYVHGNTTCIDKRLKNLNRAAGTYTRRVLCRLETGLYRLMNLSITTPPDSSTIIVLNCTGRFLGKDCSSAQIATCLGVLSYCRLKRAPLIKGARAPNYVIPAECN